MLSEPRSAVAAASKYLHGREDNHTNRAVFLLAEWAPFYNSSSDCSQDCCRRGALERLETLR